MSRIVLGHRLIDLDGATGGGLWDGRPEVQLQIVAGMKVPLLAPRGS